MEHLEPTISLNGRRSSEAWNVSLHSCVSKHPPLHLLRDTVYNSDRLTSSKAMPLEWRARPQRTSMCASMVHRQFNKHLSSICVLSSLRIQLFLSCSLFYRSWGIPQLSRQNSMDREVDKSIGSREGICSHQLFVFLHKGHEVIALGLERKRTPETQICLWRRHERFVQRSLLRIFRHPQND